MAKTKRYMTYNPLNGENTEHGTEDEAIAAFTNMLIELALTYSHGVPYTTIEYDEETGSQTMYVDPNLDLRKIIASATGQN